MTVAAKEPLAAAVNLPKRRKRNVRAGNAWQRLWQVPMLLAGAAVFALGVRHLVQTIHPVSFESQVKAIQSHIDAGDFQGAIAEINLINESYRQPAQQAVFQVLAGDSLFLAEKKLETQGSIVRDNYVRTLEHYGKAIQWGYKPTVAMQERWGEAALATGDAKVAAEHLEAAISGAGEQGADLTNRHGRELIAAYLETGARGKALEMVDRVLKVTPAGPDADQDALEQRTWALCKRIEIALASQKKPGDKEALDKAVLEARGQVESLAQRDPIGRVLTWIGRAEFDRGDKDGAEKDLTAARKQFGVHHVDDGRAALMLGMIKLDHGDVTAAAKLFQEVVAGHAGTTLWPAARWGRAMAATRRDVPADEATFADYHYAIQVVKDDHEKAPVGKVPELIAAEGVRESLIDGYKRALAGKRLVEALAFLKLEKEMGGKETPELALRLATTRELRGNELLTEAGKLERPASTARQVEGRAMLALSADDYLRHAKMVTMNDEQSGTSLWKAGELLDRAGQTMQAAEVYDGLTKMRPRDPRASEGLLALGRLYESAGLLDKAIEAHERNIKLNPKAPASYSSAVAVAQCYITLGDHAPDHEKRDKDFAQAEGFLLAQVQDNTDLQPAAREFRESLVTLGDLYYAWSTKIDEENAAKGPESAPAATGPAATAPAPTFAAAHWSDAILRLDEAIKRYGNDANWEGAPRVRFMLAESYRKSAIEIASVLARNPVTAQRADLEKARMDRLELASQEFGRLIGLLDTDTVEATAGKRKLTGLEADYLRTAYLNRAACYLERGEYEESISLYDRAAARFSEELIAVQAYVQIVNAYLRGGKPSQAAAAAERGRWMLKRVPDAAFEKSVAGANRAYFEKLLSLGGV